MRLAPRFHGIFYPNMYQKEKKKTNIMLTTAKTQIMFPTWSLFFPNTRCWLKASILHLNFSFQCRLVCLVAIALVILTIYTHFKINHLKHNEPTNERTYERLIWAMMSINFRQKSNLQTRASSLPSFFFIYFVCLLPLIKYYINSYKCLKNTYCTTT